MTVFNLIPHAIKVIACVSRAGSTALLGRRCWCLPSQGHGLGQGGASGLREALASSAPSLAGARLRAATSSQHHSIRVGAAVGVDSQTRREFPSRLG